jgi:hypothetical protein
MDDWSMADRQVGERSIFAKWAGGSIGRKSRSDACRQIAALLCNLLAKVAFVSQWPQ